ncbi:hypothetical protein KKI93_19225, partial [Xenorhabdus bovienii]|nr:hypothetical protein [Xenorhabdus bovienii]
ISLSARDVGAYTSGEVDSRVNEAKSLANTANQNAANAYPKTGGIITADNNAIDIKNSLGERANYIRGIDVNGVPRWLMGCTSNTDVVELHNSVGEVSLRLRNGWIDVNGQLLAGKQDVSRLSDTVSEKMAEKLPNTATVNGKLLRDNPRLTAADIGATILSDLAYTGWYSEHNGSAWAYTAALATISDLKNIVICGAEWRDGGNTCRIGFRYIEV